jgi:hypothetical protein
LLHTAFALLTTSSEFISISAVANPHVAAWKVLDDSTDVTRPDICVIGVAAEEDDVPSLYVKEWKTDTYVDKVFPLKK